MGRHKTDKIPKKAPRLTKMFAVKFGRWLLENCNINREHALSKFAYKRKLTDVHILYTIFYKEQYDQVTQKKHDEELLKTEL